MTVYFVPHLLWMQLINSTTLAVRRLQLLGVRRHTKG